MDKVEYGKPPHSIQIQFDSGIEVLEMLDYHIGVLFLCKLYCHSPKLDPSLVPG